MQNTQNAIIPNLNHDCDEQKLEVSLESSENGQRAVLRYSTWTDGLGWCSQKTIRLDAEQLDQLNRVLTVARHRINRDRAEAGQIAETAKIIPFPTLA